MLELLRDSLKKRAERQRGQQFLEATMAASALVAYADGAISFAERMRLDQILEQLHALQAFEVHAAIDRFNDFIEALDQRPDEGRARVLDAVRVFSGDAAESRLMIRAACALCIADDDFSEAEQREVAALCAALKIRPEDCDLEEIIRPGAEGSETGT